MPLWQPLACWASTLSGETDTPSKRYLGLGEQKEGSQMKLLLLAVLLSLAPVHKPVPEPQFKHPKIRPVKGAWYMKPDGHAVYCYGPTKIIETEHGLQMVATMCRGDELVVPLHD